MVLIVEVGLLPILSTIRASADVAETDDVDVYATVTVVPGQTAVARLSRGLRGSRDEGTVLREVMLATTGMHGPGYFVWHCNPALPHG